MADWPSALEASWLSTEGEDLAGSGGTLVTPGSSANTKGSWAQIVSSTPGPADGFLLTVQVGEVQIADYLLDIGVGAAASEQVILENVLFCSGGGDSGPARAFIPLPIAAGARVAARCQSTDPPGGSAAALRVFVTLVSGGWFSALRLGRATTYGADTTDSGGVVVDPGATAHTKGAWAQITSSLTNPFKCCLVCIGNRANTVQSSQNALLDLGVGAAASEVVLADNLYYRVQATEEIKDQWIWLPVSAKSGQRLAARAQSSSTDATDRLVDVAVIGFD